MALPEAVLTLAGFALAHGAITASDLQTTSALPPFAIVQSDADKRLVQFDGGSDADSVRRSREALQEFAANADGWAFVRPGKMWRGLRQTDVLIIEFKGRGMDRPATIIQRVQRDTRHRDHHGQRYGRSEQHREDWEHRRDEDHRSPHAGDNGQPTQTSTGSSAQEPAPSTQTTTTAPPSVQLVSDPALVTSGTVPNSGTVDSGVRTTTQYSLTSVQQGVQLYPNGSTLLTTTTPAQ